MPSPVPSSRFGLSSLVPSQWSSIYLSPTQVLRPHGSALPIGWRDSLVTKRLQFHSGDGPPRPYGYCQSSTPPFGSQDSLDLGKACSRSLLFLRYGSFAGVNYGLTPVTRKSLPRSLAALTRDRCSKSSKWWSEFSDYVVEV